MSGHLSHRLTRIHRAVSMALLYSVSYAALVSSAQAATIGKTVVTSAQHEPLAATILVTDIKTADFSAGLANSAIYQQMGLTPTDSMTVRFQPTSATSGQVFITTTKPVSKPFADVVLAINDGNQRNVIPKTLLMPLSDSVPLASSKNIVSAEKKPNLPMVSSTNAQPLTVRKGAPPPLLLSYNASKPALNATKLSESTIQTPSIQAPITQIPSMQASSAQTTNASSDLPTAVATNQSNTTTYAPSRLENGRLNSPVDVNNSVLMTNANNNNAGVSASANSMPSAADANDKQFDILNIQVTRQIQPKDKTINSNNSNNTALNDIAVNSMPSNPAALQQEATRKLSSSSADSTKLASTEINYTVQRNDNLWVIAQQIADKNNIDVQTVMKEIQTQNPDAFINKNANQLKKDAQLSLPNYDVLPSQQKLEAAINAQRQYRAANTPAAKKPVTPKATPKSESVQTAKRAAKPVTTKTQALPKAQFSVLAPGHEGSADGTKTKAGVTAGNGLSTDVLTLLKSSRKSTASQAQQLSKTSGTLDSYTRKLQLQNQKLAELQARLKKLRNQ
ncbi:FimV family protein [Psychrobacter glacincola]|uniref:type IV pilus assembly protein FimV n=1 Tax=Psychrobacter glacincola TaxID=56810 RepID=UPI0039B109EF